MSGRSVRYVALGALVVALVIAILFRRERAHDLARPARQPLDEPPRSEPEAPVVSQPAPVAPPVAPVLATRDAAVPTRTPPMRLFARVRWGSGPEQLGHERPSEGAPEAPMSLAQDGSGRVLVLDQVNHRIVRFDADGHAAGTIPIALRAAQDLAVARDGSIAVLDRLGDRTVALFAADGTPAGRLPLEGRGVPEGGGTTGLFVDGSDVYVEREHGALVRIGDTRGTPDPSRPEIDGRPSRDGHSWVSAGMTDARAGRYWVNSIARDTRRPRFSRGLQSELMLHGILLLDTDRAGIVYVAIEGEPWGAAPGDPSAATVRLVCLAANDGHTLGEVTLPVSTSPDETFRAFVVLDEGGVIYAVPGDDGETLQRCDCRGET